MRSNIVNGFLARGQNKMYETDLCCSMPVIGGRLGTIPVAILDVGMEVLKTPLGVIEAIVFAALNFFGAAFSSQCRIKDALEYVERSVANTLYTPIAVRMAPIKLIYQVFAMNLDHLYTGSINYYPEAGAIHSHDFWSAIRELIEYPDD